jgi:hypothetical protein
MAQLELSEIQLGIASLEARFAGRIEINARLTRQLVSFQANKERPIFRWFKYKEGFSAQLVDYLLDKLNLQEGCLLDPFAGIGTTLFAASQRGMASVGIELLPAGCTVIEAQQLARSQKTSELSESLVRWRSERPWLFAPHRKSYPHLRMRYPSYAEELFLRVTFSHLRMRKATKAKRLFCHDQRQCAIQWYLYSCRLDLI